MLKLFFKNLEKFEMNNNKMVKKCKLLLNNFLIKLKNLMILNIFKINKI